jgi:hypothetical protein
MYKLEFLPLNHHQSKKDKTAGEQRIVSSMM